MLRNYLTVALRSLRKQGGYTALNVGGLGLGLACCFLLALFIGQELGYDRFHANAGRIHRVLIQWDAEGQPSATTAAGITSQWVPRIPAVESAVRVENFRSPYVRIGDELRKIESLALADPSLFRVFSFPLLRGNPATALARPDGLVLTETEAQTLFGAEDPMGQTLVMPSGDAGDVTLTVTGIMADVPATSSFTFDAVGSFLLLRQLAGPEALENFTNSNFRTYLLLRPGADPEAVGTQLEELARAEFSEGGEADDTNILLQPLPALHFDTDIVFNEGSVRDKRYVYLFGAAALLILLIACVNFMNLATARATQRAKEVGVRKALGAQQGQLVRQFLSESVVQSLAALAVAALLALAALPAFNAAMGTELTLGSGGLQTVLLLVGLGLLAGVAAGTYPAIFLSAFQPTRVLRGEISRGRGAVNLRRVLIVTQFVVSVFLIVATLTVYRQLGFMQTQSLGFDREQVVFLSPPGDLYDRYDAFRERLTEDPRIVSAARAGGLPGRVGTNRGYNWPGAGAAAGTDGEEQGASFWTAPADGAYVETLGLELLAGRSFRTDAPADTMDSYILNETAISELGYGTPEEAVGQPFRAWDRPMGTIVGVVKDFHFQGLQETIQPLVLNEIPWYGYVALRLAPGDPQEALAHVRAVWNEFAPGYPFDYKFLDEDFDRLYKNEEKLGRLFGFFAAIAVFIACLGLFGLAAYAADRRTREIGVRKVLGATPRDVVLLLSKEFTALVGVAFVLATPLAWFVMHRWLEDFAYRITLGPAVFLLAGVLALAIGFVTVSTQALRAASIDPVRALRHE